TELRINQSLERCASDISGADLAALAVQVTLKYRLKRVPIGFGGLALLEHWIATAGDLSQDRPRLPARLVKIEHARVADGVAPTRAVRTILRNVASAPARHHGQSEAGQALVPKNRAFGPSVSLGGTDEAGGQFSGCQTGPPVSRKLLAIESVSRRQEYIRKLS